MIAKLIGVTSVTTTQFAAHADVQALWPIAPCEMIAFPDCRIVRLNSFMEYELVKAPGMTTEFVKWGRGSRYHMVDLLKEGEGNLVELGDLAGQPQAKLVKWLSVNGLLGFRPARALSQPELLHIVNLGTRRIHGSENRMLFAYEPVCLVREAAQIAKAASKLYDAIRSDDQATRREKLAAILEMNPDTRAGHEIEMRVCGVPIGLHIAPQRSAEWTRVALEGLATLTDRYLPSEFSLYWEEDLKSSRNLTYGWKVHSHFGALSLKMAHRRSERRYCEVCNAPLHARSRTDAMTCGPTCRKRRQRRRTSN